MTPYQWEKGEGGDWVMGMGWWDRKGRGREREMKDNRSHCYLTFTVIPT